MSTETDEAIASDLAQVYEREVIDVDGFDEWLANRGYAWQKIDRGEYNFSIEQAQLRYICEDPVLWCKAFMTEPDNGEPYTFWPYQQESVRAWHQDAVHQDGAEVGKTREITALVIWGMSTGFGFTIQNPKLLVAAPQQTHLDEIIMGVEAHFGVGDGAEGRPPVIQRFWLKPKRVPHTMHKFKGLYCTKGQIGMVYYRPAGHDGEAFRGVHVNAGGLFDEAAKIKSKVVWSEFYRALMPGAFARRYSVPDGDNTTDFYRDTQEAIEDLPISEPGVRLFHWPKTLMPAPFWTAERDKVFQARYGGKDTPGYQRNVLGLHGQQENPVWPWETIEANLHDVPGYLCFKLLGDAQRNELEVLIYRIEFEINKGKKISREATLAEYTLALDDFKTKNTDEVRQAVRKIFREFVEPTESGVYWFGGDLGETKDPTELLVAQEVGSELRDVLRVHTKGVGYDVQCEIIHAVDWLFGHRSGWGVDYGNAGTAVVQMMHNQEQFDDGNYDERMVGFQFSSAMDAIDEEGNALVEEDDKGNEKAVRLPAKELATNLITTRLQRQGFALAYDNEVIGHYTNHTAKEGARHRIFDKKNDHTIDARRAMMLRKAFDEDLGGGSVFSSGVHKRVAA